MTDDMNRRKFLQAAGPTAAFTVVPRRVLGGPGYVAPSDKTTLAYIGLGTEGLREMLWLLPMQDIQIVAVCDPNKDSNDYRDWSKDSLRNTIRKAIGKPNWREGVGGILGGREVGREVIETYYANERSSDNFKGIASYADFRELLDKENFDAVQIMTPDHLHATISIAAMKKGKHVLLHKPIANRLYESRLVLETSRKTKVATHFIPWGYNGSMDTIMAWIRDGAIGTLREVHNWTNRPVWPQYQFMPTGEPPIPKDFDWNLWLGPALDRPYHPDYTHAVFRGWYDFGGGALADMGYYSLWVVFEALKLGVPFSVEAMSNKTCTIKDQVSVKVDNSWSFPTSCAIRFKFAARGDMPALDLVWYDGGMRPPTPGELEAQNKELAAEGMMFVGDRGKILSGFNLQNPQILPEANMRAYQGTQPAAVVRGGGGRAPGVREWLTACKGGAPSPGNFLNAAAISETFNLGVVALRAGRRIQYDAENMRITNIPEANKYLYREYRKGWEL